MTIIDLIGDYSSTKYFILDSHQGAMEEQEAGHRYEDSDYIGYSYNIHQFNKLIPGALFLYRRPGKLSPDKLFHIYGGGMIESISDPDEYGNVIAKIKLGFEFDKTIDQGDEFIENYQWKTRNKPGPGWKGFWTNYGMNEINADDFWNIVEERRCHLSGNQVSKIQTIEENEVVGYDYIEKGFELNINNSKTGRDYKKFSLAKKIDFNEINRKNKTVGTTGELIVLEYENEKLKKLGINKKPEHVAKTIGDGLGYDIKSYDEDGKEIHIEVKTTKTNLCDNFFMTKREIEESSNSDFNYYIYRIYNYNDSNNTSDLVIYSNDDINKLFEFEPASYRVKYK